jgi:hypothetical protein
MMENSKDPVNLTALLSKRLSKKWLISLNGKIWEEGPNNTGSGIGAFPTALLGNAHSDGSM